MPGMVIAKIVKVRTTCREHRTSVEACGKYEEHHQDIKKSHSKWKNIIDNIKQTFRII